MQCEAGSGWDQYTHVHAHPLCQHGGGEQNGRCGSGGDTLREGYKWGKQMVTSMEGTSHEFSRED